MCLFTKIKKEKKRKEKRDTKTLWGASSRKKFKQN